ncbi:MAG TPA: hypothetical protein VK040_07445 [Balneolaceae bacterium]|nr:hypothetical protein [Balneolaceae bacterium]
MKKFTIIAVILFIFAQTGKIQAQSNGQLIGGNIVNGAVTGAILGTATMGLQNDSDWTPLRVGVGAGLLGGAGLAIYDVATLPQGQQFFISGSFNDGTNTSVIILLDTVYGSGLGATMGAAIALITNSSFLEGVKYGASAGAWAGFGYGLVDAFALAERNRDFVSEVFSRSSLVELDTGIGNIGLASPAIFQTLSTGIESLNYKVDFGVNLVSLRGTF